MEYGKKARTIPPEEREQEKEARRSQELARINEAFNTGNWPKLRFIAGSLVNLAYRLRGICDERQDKIKELKAQLAAKQTCDACELVNSLRVQLAATEIKLDQTTRELACTRRNLEYAIDDRNSYQIKYDLMLESVNEAVALVVLERQLIRQLHEDLAKYIDRPKETNANNSQEASD